MARGHAHRHESTEIIKTPDDVVHAAADLLDFRFLDGSVPLETPEYSEVQGEENIQCQTAQNGEERNGVQ